MAKTTNILDLNNRLEKVEKENVAQNSYTSLKNKPKINGVTLTGNKSLADIGAAAASDLTTLAGNVGDKTQLTTTDKSSCVGAINELNNAIVVSRVTASSAIEVSTTNITQFTIPATKSGYKPIGIVGWGASSGNSNIFIVEVHIDGSGNVDGYLRNVGSSQASVSGLRFDVLYAKDV